MQTITSGKFRANFKETVEIAKYCEPLIVTQYGKPAVVVMSYAKAIELLRQQPKTQETSYFNQQTSEMLLLDDDKKGYQKVANARDLLTCLDD